MHHLSDAGINIVAHLNEESGTSIAARAVVDVLQRGGVPLAYFELPSQPEARRGMQTLFDTAVPRFDELPYRHMLFLDLPFVVNDIYESFGEYLAQYKVATVLYWELEHLPVTWRDTYANIDVAFAPSTLVRTALRNSSGVTAPLIPVVPQDMQHPPKASQGERPFTFVMNFDILSSLNRKNPRAPIAAFIEAFGNRRDVQLLIKIWEFDHAALDRAPLLELEQRYPAIKHIFGDFSYAQTRELLASADAYISLHRSEGLGLGMLEALAAGVPVIATDYGGSADFIDTSCGFAVPYTMIDTEGNDMIYNREHIGQVAQWADPDVSYAASAMQQIVADRSGYVKLAAGARRRYDERRVAFESLDWLAPFYDARRPLQTFTGELEASCTTPR